MNTTKTVTILVLLCIYRQIHARPPSSRGSGTREDSPAASSQRSSEEVRALLERIRSSQNTNYYDNSLLQDSGELPGRNAAPNEYSHVDNGTPGASYNPLTIGANPANSQGIPQNWQGGAPSSSNNNNNNNGNTQGGLSIADLFPGFELDSRTNSSRTPGSDDKACDLIGPNACPLPLGFENTETRTEEEIKKDLWQPSEGSREEWLRCNGMPCEDKTLAEDLMEQLQYELTNSTYQSPESAGPMSRCDSEHCRDMLKMLGCARFTVAQLYDMLLALRMRRDLDKPEPEPGRERPSTNTRHKRKLIDFKINSFQKWPAGQAIPYMFDGTHSFAEQQIVRNAFKHWEEKTCVRFQELNRANNYQYQGRINYILITSQNDGCFAYIGMVPQYKPQQLNLQRKCLTEFGVPVHEIGHALGYWHEHQRVDRDNFVRIVWNDVGSYPDQFDRAQDTIVNPCPYDYSSVMHYAPRDGSSTGGVVLRSIDPLYQKSMGQRTGLSFLDTKCINNAYCSDVCRNQPLRGGTCAHAGYQDPKRCNQCRCADGLGGTFCNSVEPSTSGCGGEINLQQGGQARTIATPNYPRQYQENVKCNWKITAPAGCKVQISVNRRDAFGIYAHDQGQCYHWLEVKHTSDFGKAGPRFCGSSFGNVQQLTSDTNVMYATFRSDFTVPRNVYTGQANVNYQLVGFKAQVSTVQCPTNPIIPPGGGDCTFQQQYSCRNQAQCVRDNSIQRYRCICSAGYTGTYCETQCPNFNCISNPGIPEGCPRAFDLVFILDSSGSVQWFNWPKMTELAANIVDQLTIAYDAVHVGVIVFGNDATNSISLGANNNAETLKTRIRALRYYPMWTNTAAGLREANNALGLGRQNAPNKAILVTDGPSNQNSYLTLPNAQTLRNSNTEIIAVAIGSNVDQTELQGITGDPKKVINVVAGFDALDDVATATLVVNQMCGTDDGGTGGPGGPGGSVSFTCGFEDDFCGMRHGGFQFQRNQGGTTSFGTGPTSAAQGRYYAYIETSYGRQLNDVASLTIPSSALQSLASPATLCLRLKYHMYGQGIGTFKVYVVKNGGYRESNLNVSGNKGTMWQSAALTLNNVRSTDQIIIEASTTSSPTVSIYQGDIAIDDVRLSSGRC